METKRLAAAIEAVLFVTGEAVSQKEFCSCFGVTYTALEDAFELLRGKYSGDSGIVFIAYGDSMQLSSNPEYRSEVEEMLNPVQRKSLSQASLEVLSIIAYKQPITRSEIEEIRGVKCDYSVMWLLQKGLIKEAGRKDTVGKPMLFATTDLFLRHFGLSGLDELPEKPRELLDAEAEPE
ncbi:MAG: SMC-Scp complex subunit ScpB [Firmicutes bacterium]|nr:SMC-Scp complex subunit ScpB [Bacillota bacterium]